MRVQLSQEGILLNIKAENGDPDLCKVAIFAARQAHIPKPKNNYVYEIFKNAPLDFKPQ